MKIADWRLRAVVSAALARTRSSTRPFEYILGEIAFRGVLGFDEDRGQLVGFLRKRAGFFRFADLCRDERLEPALGFVGLLSGYTQLRDELLTRPGPTRRAVVAVGAAPGIEQLVCDTSCGRRTRQCLAEGDDTNVKSVSTFLDCLRLGIVPFRTATNPPREQSRRSRGFRKTTRECAQESHALRMCGRAESAILNPASEASIPPRKAESAIPPSTTRGARPIQRATRNQQSTISDQPIRNLQPAIRNDLVFFRDCLPERP